MSLDKSLTTPGWLVLETTNQEGYEEKIEAVESKDKIGRNVKMEKKNRKVVRIW